MDSAVAIVSGGLDSSGVAAFWKEKRRASLHMLTFDYGQRASREIESARFIAEKLRAEKHHVLDISFMKDLYGGSNVLTDEKAEMPSSFQSNIIVPLRNAVFLSIATAYAFSIGSNVVAYGAHLTDSPYPDCRPEFARDFASSLNLGDVDAIKSGAHPPVKIWSPATEGLSKSDLLKISYEMLGQNIYATWSCYLNREEQCGVCESCRNRRNAFETAGIPDKTKYLETVQAEEI